MPNPSRSTTEVRIGAIRSGLVEARHDVSVVAATAGGVIESFGDQGDQFFLRSAAKPFQAVIAQEAGAALMTEQMAVACGSHGGQPVHIALVRMMLAEVGLDETDLLCPPARPMSIHRPCAHYRSLHLPTCCLAVEY